MARLPSRVPLSAKTAAGRAQLKAGQSPVLHTGPRGGKFYYGQSGEKIYPGKEGPPGMGRAASRFSGKGLAETSEETINLYRSSSGQWDQSRVQQVHEAYIARVTAGVPRSANPVVHMTGGGPASGKSTGLLENPAAGIPGKSRAVHTDPDDAKKTIPEYGAMVKAGRKDAAALAHEESSHMSKMTVGRALGRGHDVVYDSTGDSGIDKLHAKVQEMRAAGAREVHASYATVDVNEAIRRSDSRAARTGRFVPHEYIRKTHQDVARTTQAAIERGTFDSMKVFDTTGAKPKLIASYTRSSGLQVHDAAEWEAHKSRGR